MSYSFSRDRTAELKDSFDQSNNSSSETTDHLSPRNITTQRSRPSSRYYNSQNEEEKEEERAYEMSERTVTSDMNTLDGFFEEVEQLKRDITMIDENVDVIEQLHTQALMSSNDQQWHQLSKQLENIKTDTKQRNNHVKQKLSELDSANSRQTNDVQIRKTQFSALKKRFMDSIKRYQDIERSYQYKYRERIERQIKIVKPEATQEEIDDMINTVNEDGQIFTQSILHASRRTHANAVMSEVQTRHDDIKKIEKTIVELHQLFMDMQMMVEQQKEVVEQIEQNADTTANDLEQGTKLVTRAVKTAKATRAKKWCCFFLAIGICVMIAILVWWFGFDHKGVGGN